MSGVLGRVGKGLFVLVEGCCGLLVCLSQPKSGQRPGPGGGLIGGRLLPPAVGGMRRNYTACFMSPVTHPVTLIIQHNDVNE